MEFYVTHATKQRKHQEFRCLDVTECCHALDHLRNALDGVPRHSASAFALIGLMRRLAAFIDSATVTGLRR